LPTLLGGFKGISVNPALITIPEMVKAFHNQIEKTLSSSNQNC
jgi:hypothetical protein